MTREVSMVRFALLVLLALVVAIAAAMTWQHRRYLHARRAFVQDHQPVLHSGRVFHVVTFLELAPGADLFDALRKLRDTLEAGGAKVVYAGKVALNARPSDQLIEVFGEAVPWDAVVCVQYPSREDWERLSQSAGFERAHADFARTYAHGMRRSALPNLLLPQALLARRAAQIVRRERALYPFEKASPEGWTMEDRPELEKLRAERELGRDAAVVVNLILSGDAEQAEADGAYVERMFALMAEVGNGPMHMGEAVTLEHGTHFENVAIVYYPGVEYFQAMVQSRYFQGIIGDKQLGDTQASITVPVLDRL